MGGILSKTVCDDNVRALNLQNVSFPCLSRVNDNSVLHHEHFKDMRRLLFDAVGFNGREIYKKLLTDYYTTSTHISLTTMQDVFGLQFIKTPKQTKKHKDIITQYINILIKSGEFERDNSKRSAFFLVFYLKSNNSLKIASKVVDLHSLKVDWNEYLSIPIQMRKEFKDELIVEIGNFYNLTTVCNNAVNAFEQSANINAMRKLVLETSNCTVRQMLCKSMAYGKVSVDDEFLGDSHDMAIKLKMKGEKVFGEVHLQVEICESPSKEFLAKEHEVVTYLGLMHDNEVNNATYLTSSTEAIFEQHRKLTHLSTFESFLIRWITLSKIHNLFPFDYAVLDNTILKLHQFVFDTEIPHSLTFEYNHATKLILTLALTQILEFRNDNHAFSVLEKILVIKPHVKREHHSNLHSPVRAAVKIDDELTRKIEDSINSAVNVWWCHNTKGMSFQNLEDIIKFLDDIQEYQETLVQAYSKTFKTLVHINLNDILKIDFITKISKVIVPVLANNATKLSLESEMIDKDLTELMNRESIKKYFEHLVRATDTDLKETGTNLFLVIQKLQSLQGNEHGEDILRLSETSFEFWINEAIAKAMICVERAVDLDNFTVIHDNVRHSSSAVDFLGILREIQIFWTDISNLSDNQNLQNIDTKMIQGVVKVVQLFIHFSIKKCKDLVQFKGSLDSYINLWIIFMHDVYYIKAGLVENLLPERLQKQEFCLKDILFELKVDKGFAMHLVTNIQHDLGIEKCVDEFLYDELKIKYENVFAILCEEFKSSSDFKELCKEIWNESLNFFDQIIDKAIESGAHIEFYCHLRETFKSISHICTKIVDDPTLEFMIDRTLERKLFLNSTESDDLIEQYFVERYKSQNAETSKAVGTLTVAIKHAGDKLQITILNVKDLVPVEYKTSCDPYVKIRFVPHEHFKLVDKYQTKSKSKTTCALFDETFNIELEKINVHGNNFIHFVVVEKELVVKVQLGEAFLPLTDVLLTPKPNEHGDLTQLHLKLTKPSIDSEIIKALEYREHHDKVAKEFLKHFKSQLNHGSWATVQHHLHTQHTISDFIHSHTKSHFH